MQKKVRHILYNLLCGMLVLHLFSCNYNTFDVYNGNTQGTTFAIKYEFNGDKIKLHEEIDSILLAVDESISTYNNQSVISAFNRSDSGINVDPLFQNVLRLSQKVYQASEGDFDPSVAPLVWAYGFGPMGDTILSDVMLDSIKMIIGLSKMHLKENFLFKLTPSAKLDFNAIGQGYTVDLVAEHLEAKGIENFLVEIGGEVRVKGKNQDRVYWKIGIDRPLENLPKRQIHSVISLDNKSFATSGNYRKFYEKDGQKYTHTIDPISGKSVLSTLLSATVIHESCALADAYATALMVKGTQKGIAFADAMNLEVYLIYSENNELKEYISSTLEETINH